MTFLFTSARRHLCVLTRTAEHIRIPQIPRTRPITYAPRSYPPPPLARRRLEPAPSSTTSKPQDNYNTARPASGPQGTRRPINHQIPFSHVHVLDPSTNTLSPTKQRLEDLLATRQRSAVIELVASSPKPIVRVTTRRELEARYRALRRTSSSSSRAGAEPKEVQLTWGVASADLEHKMRKARRDLEKGYRVVVAVAVKRSHRPSSRQEMVAFADEIAEALAGVGQEYKERDISDRLMVLSFRKAAAGEDVP